MSKASTRIYRIFFTSQGKAYELYARKVQTGDLMGFVEVEELVFGEKSSLVVDPSEDALRKEFSGVRRMHLPFHSIVRIEEVEKEGAGKVLSIVGSDTPAPSLPPGLTRKRD